MEKASSSLGALLLRLLACTFVGLVLNLVVRALMGKFGSRDVNGSPIWTWAIGVTCQATVFPLTMIIAGFQATEESVYMRRLAMYIAWGYVSKDLFFPLNAAYIAHHIACMVSIVVVLWSTPDVLMYFSAHAVFVTMEMGSLASALTLVFEPRSKLWLSLHIIIMSASNVVAFWFFSFLYPLLAPFGWLIFIFIAVAAVIRQQSAMESVRELWTGNTIETKDH